MYMRFLRLRLQPEGLDLSRTYYDTTVLPRLRTIKGCRFARLIQNQVDKTEVISLTLWKSRGDAEAYEKSPVFKQLLAEFKPFLAESSEWKIQLSEKKELEYKPEPEEPEVESFPISVLFGIRSLETETASSLYVRILSHKLQTGKLEEFKNLYKTEIIPLLRNTPGCLYAYLLENLQNGEEIISITIWENQKAADDYEKSGRFHKLVDRVKHTYSQLLQWKMALRDETGRLAKTSDDMQVDHYTIVSGQEF